MSQKLPEILSPAGDKECFFAAILAGADAVYIGLKEFSARAKATNFDIKELISLSEFANLKGVKVYVALNSIIYEDELTKIFFYLEDLAKFVKPDALIIQDPGLLNLIHKNFDFEIHISTLANVSLACSFNFLKKLGVQRVVLPRELTIDEIKYLSQNCGSVGLEVFVHGALCYGVSGRCYWSGMLGGKMGLRGECVQPCRRIYTFNDVKGKYFSCRDLSLDVLIKILMKIPQVVSFKIEGRKKSPHYVYYITKAYKILRDNINDSKAKKFAMELIEMSLGRPTTHYFFLSHRRYIPVDPYSESASGYEIGKTFVTKGKVYIRPKIDLMAGDRIRISYEDKKGHNIIKINRFIKKGKKHTLNIKTEAGQPVFLIDRKESKLVEGVNKLKGEWLKIANNKNKYKYYTEELEPRKPRINLKKSKHSIVYLTVYRDVSKVRRRKKGLTGIWVYDPDFKPGFLPRDTWIFLDPVLWPEDEDRWKRCINNLVSKGIKFFVFNSLFHASLTPLDAICAWLGPFSNITNSEGLNLAFDMGFKGAVLSPELKDINLLADIVKASPIPLGVFVKGLWPYTISRTKHEEIPLKAIIYSPRNEPMWMDRLYKNYYLFPKKEINLTSKMEQLKSAGFKLFLEFAVEASLKEKPFNF
ncbi:peptidase U32 family protein [Desulfothermus naphthae]